MSTVIDLAVKTKFDKKELRNSIMDLFLGGLFFVLLIFGVTYGSIEKSKARDKLDHLKHSTIPSINQRWATAIEVLETMTEASCKCNLPTYRIFNINTDESIEYRCTTCSIKRHHSGEYIKSAFGETLFIISLINDIVDFENEFSELSSMLISGYAIERGYHIHEARGPWYRGIHFRPRKITEKTVGKRRRTISTETKQIVFERDNGKCVNCNSNVDLEYDHIIPFSRGGSNGPNNIQLLCRKCNSKKRAKII